MLDTFRLLHGERRRYSYRPRNKPWGAGGDRVDMILATKELKGAVKEADVLDSEVERGPSDHVPLFLEVQVVAMNTEKDTSSVMPTIKDYANTRYKEMDGQPPTEDGLSTA